MKNVVNNYLDRLRDIRKILIRMVPILCVLAVIVAVGVFWQLRYTGLAMVNGTCCGYEEHMHDLDCYTPVLVCGLEESDEISHVHDKSCYETAETLVCEIPESDGHSHDNFCLDEDGDIICGLEENAGHSHSDACYEENQILTCGLEESDGGHVHSQECYETVLICELPEHVHTALCMSNENADVETAKDWEQTLPEEIPDNWAEAVVAVARSQIGYTESAQNFQIADDGVTAKGYTRYGAWYGVPYGDWDGMFVAFCLDYAGVPVEEFPGSSGVYAWVTMLKQMVSEDETEGPHTYADAKDYTPVAGDVIFFDEDGDDRADHVGIVEEVETRTDGRTGEVTVTGIRTIEGDVSDTVCEKEYLPDDGTIIGYGILPENPDAAETEPATPAEDTAGIEPENMSVTVSGEPDGPEEASSDEPAVSGEPETSEEMDEPETVIYTAEDGGVLVEVAVPAGALPDGAELTVTLADEDSEDYIEAQELVEEAAGIPDLRAAGEGNDCSFIIAVEDAAEDAADDRTDISSDMALLDISFLLDGEKVEPAESADVTIDVSVLLDGCEDGISSLFVWHLEETEDGTDPVMVSEIYGGEEAEFGIAEFSVESFSDFAVHWFPNYSDTSHFGRIYVNLFDAETGEKIQGRTNTLDYDAGTYESIDLSAGSDFIKQTGADGTRYLFSYGTVTAKDGGENTSSEDNPVKYVILTFNEAQDSGASWEWTYTFYNAKNEIVYSYSETGRGNSEPELNLYFTTEPYVITWNGNNGTSYISYEVRDAYTGVLLGHGEDWEKPDTNTDIAMVSNGLLRHVTLTTGYSYSYAVVTDPGSGTVYGPVTAVGGKAVSDGSGGSIWTFTVKAENGDEEEIIREYESGSGIPDPSDNLLITLYYTDGNAEKNVAFESRTGGMGYGGRDYIYGLENYVDSENKITITLPDNSDLGKDFVVFDAGNGFPVTVNVSEIAGWYGFKWKVVGWYNIADGTYVDVSEGPAEVTIDLDNTNVFYADLIAATYDNVDAGRDADILIETDSTEDFVTVKLFDYNELFNLYSCYLTQYGIEHENWDAGFGTPDQGNGALFNVPILSTDPDSLVSEHKLGRSFLFTSDALGTDDKGYHWLILPDNRNYWNTWTGNSAVDSYSDPLTGQPLTNNVISAGTWSIDSPDSPLLQMLFNESEGEDRTYGVHYIGKADYMFQYGEDLAGDLAKFNGYYYYSSDYNAAVYDQSEERMYIYDTTINYSSGQRFYTMFVPFNPFQTGNLDSHQIDYWFGMEMEVRFYLPGAAGEKENSTTESDYKNLVDGEHMKFNFSGDDDIIVFVDDVIILNMAGVHDEADGWIDFAEGTYYYKCRNQAGMNDTDADAYEGDFKLPAGSHTLKVYYLERGAGASNLTVSFNIVPSWQYFVDEVTTVTVEKEWDDGEDCHEAVTMGLFQELLGEELDENNEVIREREYVYENNTEGSGATLIIGDATYIFADDDIYAYKDGCAAAIREGTEDDLLRFFLLVDKTPLGDLGTQILSDDNDWTFIWELLENDREYRVLELIGPDGYSSVSSVSASDTCEYWHIIGSDELEDMYEEKYGDSSIGGEKHDHWVILTDAAASWDGTQVGYPQGCVIRNNVDLQSVTLSQVPDWSKSTKSIIAAEFGVIANSEIENLANNPRGNIFVRWKIEFTGGVSEEYMSENAKEAHTFKLSSEYNDGERYLHIVQKNGEYTGTVNYTTDADAASVFYIDALGELRVEAMGGRIVIKDGVLEVVQNSVVVESGDKNFNVRVYTLSEVEANCIDYTYVNTPILPVSIFKYAKVDTKGNMAGNTVVGDTSRNYILLRISDDNENNISYAANGTTRSGVCSDVGGWKDVDEIDQCAAAEFAANPETGEITFNNLPSGYTYYLAWKDDEDGGGYQYRELTLTSLAEEDSSDGSTGSGSGESFGSDTDPDGVSGGGMKGLAGAEFILGKNVVDEDGNESTFYAVCTEAESGVWRVSDWVEDKDSAAPLCTDSEGYFRFEDLHAGEYSLMEIKAPDGYMILDGVITFTVSEDGTVTSESSGVSALGDMKTLAVENIAEKELPNTGGHAAIMNVLGGLLLIFTSVIFLYLRKRKEDE